MQHAAGSKQQAASSTQHQLAEQTNKAERAERRTLFIGDRLAPNLHLCICHLKGHNVATFVPIRKWRVDQGKGATLKETVTLKSVFFFERVECRAETPPYIFYIFRWQLFSVHGSLGRQALERAFQI